ncbi:MAG: Gfo/Idh/MocA family oxidoreductase [Candidatus Firestonebacteria bacterium]
MRFKNGSHGVVDSCFSMPNISSKNRLEVYGSKGSVLCEGTIGQLSTGQMEINIGNISGRKILKPKPINIYKAEIESFSEAIEKDKKPEISGEDGLWNQKIILECYKSAKQRKTIEL